jgi:hypothetical protein
MKYVIMAVLVLALVALGPLATIWAWNTLFGSALTIPYTVDTWAAVIIMGGVFKTSIRRD